MTGIDIFPFNIIDRFFGKSQDLATQFFQALAGQIAAGLEAAGVAILLDIWRVIAGPVEILAGILLFIIAMGIAFRDDIAGVAMLAMR
jgi:hypothetical protein